MNMKMTSNESCYFFAGLAIGAGAAVLLTPKPGAETVATLKHKAMQGVDSVKERIDAAGSTVKDSVDRGKKALRFRAENLSAAVEAGKRAYREAAETTPSLH
jgi:gas vesicle protein